MKKMCKALLNFLKSFNVILGKLLKLLSLF